MAEILNLKRFRKAKERAAEKQRAAENRALHGRTRADRERQGKASEMADRKVDGARLESGDDEPS